MSSVIDVSTSFPDPPDILVKRAEILHKNGWAIPAFKLHNGFFILGVTSATLTEFNQIKQLTESKTLRYLCFENAELGEEEQAIGLHIRWDEHKLIPEVFNTALDLGLTVEVECRYMLKFDPEDGVEYSQVEFEKKAIKAFRDLNYRGSVVSDMMEGGCLEPVMYPWNWLSGEGQVMCNPFHALESTCPDEKDNHFKSDLFKNCDFETLLDKDPEEEKTE